MKIPVIIPARNEAEDIRSTLDTLSRQALGVEPYVIVNGSTDKTADVARHSGAVVFESEEGKMRAVQAGLHYLGQRALEPLLILDADNQPFSRHWSRRMTSNLSNVEPERPAIVWGPYIFSKDINPLIGAFVTASSMYVSWADRHDEDPRTIRGGNMGLKLKASELLEELLALDNYWPREDVAIFDTVMQHDATKKVVFHPEAWMKGSGSRVTETLKNSSKDGAIRLE